MTNASGLQNELRTQTGSPRPDDRADCDGNEGACITGLSTHGAHVSVQQNFTLRAAENTSAVTPRTRGPSGQRFSECVPRPVPGPAEPSFSRSPSEGAGSPSQTLPPAAHQNGLHAEADTMTVAFSTKPASKVQKCGNCHSSHYDFGEDSYFSLKMLLT